MIFKGGPKIDPRALYVIRIVSRVLTYRAVVVSLSRVHLTLKSGPGESGQPNHLVTSVCTANFHLLMSCPFHTCRHNYVYPYPTILNFIFCVFWINAAPVLEYSGYHDWHLMIHPCRSATTRCRIPYASDKFNVRLLPCSASGDLKQRYAERPETLRCYQQDRLASEIGTVPLPPFGKNTG